MMGKGPGIRDQASREVLAGLGAFILPRCVVLTGHARDRARSRGIAASAESQGRMVLAIRDAAADADRVVFSDSVVFVNFEGACWAVCRVEIERFGDTTSPAIRVLTVTSTRPRTCPVGLRGGLG